MELLLHFDHLQLKVVSADMVGCRLSWCECVVASGALLGVLNAVMKWICPKLELFALVTVLVGTSAISRVNVALIQQVLL